MQLWAILFRLSANLFFLGSVVSPTLKHNYFEPIYKRQNISFERDWPVHLKKELLLKHSQIFVWYIYEVSRRFQRWKMKNFQNLEVSFYSVDSLWFFWKSGLIPWTKITMGGKCLIWAAKHIFSPILWFTWNRHVFHKNVIFSLYFFWSENENNYKEKFFYGESIDKKDIPVVNERWLISM